MFTPDAFIAVNPAFLSSRNGCISLEIPYMHLPMVFTICGKINAMEQREFVKQWLTMITSTGTSYTATSQIQHSVVRWKEASITWPHCHQLLSSIINLYSLCNHFYSDLSTINIELYEQSTTRADLLHITLMFLKEFRLSEKLDFQL